MRLLWAAKTYPINSPTQAAVNGFRVVLPKRREVVTVDHVRRLMDEEGI